MQMTLRLDHGKIILLRSLVERKQNEISSSKFKVVPVAPLGKGLKDLFNKIFTLRRTFFYELGHKELEYVQEEKDLGIIVSSNLMWDRQVDALLSKARSRLGLLKRTIHFIKCQKQ